MVVRVLICAGTQGVCMTKRILILIASCAVAFFCTVPAMADTMASGTLTLTNCGTPGTGCPAATYNFVVTSTSATLTIMINGGLNSTNSNLTAVDLGFTNSNNTVTMGSFTTSGNVTGTWGATTGSLSSGGQCGTNGGAFVCASVSPLNGLTLQQGQTYTFTWNYTLANPNGIFAAGDVHIGAEYGPNQGNYQGLIVSQTIPEPTSLTLLGVGLLALGGFARRRSSKN